MYFCCMVRISISKFCVCKIGCTFNWIMQHLSEIAFDPFKKYFVKINKLFSQVHQHRSQIFHLKSAFGFLILWFIYSREKVHLRKRKTNECMNEMSQSCQEKSRTPLRSDKTKTKNYVCELVYMFRSVYFYNLFVYCSRNTKHMCAKRNSPVRCSTARKLRSMSVVGIFFHHFLCAQFSQAAVKMDENAFFGVFLQCVARIKEPQP